MTHTVFIDLDSHVATASATGTASPDVPLKHLTKQTLAFAFHSGGTVSAVTGWTEGRVVVKATPTSDVLLLDTTLAATGSTTSTRYSAEWAAVDCDSAALRTLIGASVEPLDVFAEIQWTATSGTHAVSFPIQIIPTFNLPEDDPPDPTEDASWTWLKARLAAGTNVTFSDNETTKVRTIAASLTGAGSGDVTGPASSTDNALVRFDSTTGKVIQNGTVTQSDAGDLAAVNSITFDTTPTGSIAVQGQAMWNADEATVDMQLNGFVIHLGTHAVYRVKNSTGATIAKGAPVMFAGTDGNSGILLIEEWDGVGPPEYFLGPLAEELATGESGFAIMFGKLRGITTDGSDYGEAWIDGDIIYASATAGNLTKTPPAAPNALIIVCAVVHAHATNGTLFVRTTLGTVAKVAMTVPTGFSVSGSPVTSNGTLAVSYSAGYQGYTTTEADKLAAIEASADVTDAANVGSSIHGATAKTTPVDADTMPLIDSAASNALKKVTWANIKATVKSYFDALYVTGPASATDNAIARFDGTTGKVSQNSGITIADGASGTLSGTNSGDVTLAGTPDYLTLSGQQITLAQIDLTADVTGVLPIANIATGTPDGTKFVRDDGTLAVPPGGGGSGTVTSVAVSGSDGIEVDSGSPITASGTIALGINASTLSTHLGLGNASTRNVGTAVGTVAAGDDLRLSDARTPTAHAASHITGGSDAIQSATASQNGLATAAQITKLDGIEALADVTDAANVGSSIHGATAKTTPVDADTVPLIDSAASNVLKKLSWANIKATLKTYFDALYMLKSIYDPQNAGRISGADGADEELYGGASGGTGGTLSMDGGNASSFMETAIAAGSAGSINTSGGNADGAQTGGSGGSINTSGGPGISGGSINTTAGGSITTGSGDINLGNTSGTLDPHALSPLPAVAVTIQLACSDEGTALTTGTAKLTFRMPHAMTLTAVRASVKTAPTGSALVIDINEGGTSILGTKLSIDATEKTSTTAASAATITDSALADDAEITIDIDQIGSDVAGAGLKVTLIGTRA